MCDLYYVRPDIDTERLKGCYHEAGHAVVARLMNFPVAWVSVDPGFIKTNPLAIENGCAEGDPVCMTIASERINPILNTRGALTREMKETVIGYVMQTLAGPHAEYCFDPDTYLESFGHPDRAQAGQVICSVETNKKRQKELNNVARRRLVKLVKEKWPAIEAVATELFRRGTLLEGEVDNCILNAPVLAGT